MGNQKAKMKIACPGCRQKLDVTDLAPFVRINCPRCGGDVITPKPFGTLLLEEAIGQRCGVSAYRALDLTLDREVLVKILEHDIEAFGEGFQALARKAAAVNHHGVVPLYSCGAEQGLPYLVTQFMPGGALANRLEAYSVTVESIRQGVAWTRSIAGGLQAAAAQGVVHGAVTPLSILLDGEGHAKLTDFGLEVLLTSASGRAPVYARDVAAYLSPEVLSGAAPTMASDIFGLGAVLYHVLGGAGPCGPIADGEAARRLWQAGHRPPAPRSLNAGVPQELSDACMRMLCAEPRHRPADVAEIASLLATVCQGWAVSALKPADKRSRNLRVQSPHLPPPPPRPPSPSPPPAPLPAVAPRCLRPPRDRWMNVLISGCIVVALVLGMILYVRTLGSPPGVAAARPPVAALGQEAPPETTGSVATETPAATPREGSPPGLLTGQPADPAGELAAGASAPPPDAALPPPAPGATATPDRGVGALALYTARRPRPEGLDFMAAKLDLARYLRGLPPDILVGERERIDLIGDTRGYLVRLMKYVPFQASKESDIRLRSGPPLRGTVPYCNESHIAVRIRGDNVLRMVPWRELAIEQVIAFADYYIRVRLDQGHAAGGSKDGAVRREVAEDCLRTAVLCDWYERPQEAGFYARQALDANPEVAARVRRLLPNVDI